ncbi:MAG: hypothetical protein QOF22_2141 [Bradyrhizobium sp.]|nr:hypothetical protein [Bradyrhizobium sp.]
MPALTRRLSPAAREECWQIFYGDIRVGTIAKRVGIPNDQPRWGWSCGFYPGSHPGDCTGGAAATLDQALHAAQRSLMWLDPTATSACGLIFIVPMKQRPKRARNS